MENKKQKQTLSPFDLKGTESAESCDSRQSHHGITLPDGMQVKMAANCLTNHELQILAEMRQARQRAEKIKNYLKEIDKSLEKISAPQNPFEDEMTEEHFSALAVSRETKRLNEERQQLYYWLAKLREEWNRLDSRRALAAEERMRLLGHIE